MKASAIQTEISELKIELHERKQYHSSYNLRNMRKRLRRLNRELKQWLAKHKTEQINCTQQLNLI